MRKIDEFWRSERGALIGVTRARGVGRLRGLIGAAPPPPARALLLNRCRQVHSLWMSHPIDVVFIDGALRVLRVTTLTPWRASCCASARHTLELRAGECARLGIAVGDRFETRPPTTEEVTVRAAAR